MLEVEHRRVLAEVRDLEHGPVAAVVDQERRVALAAEIDCGAADPEELVRNVRDFVGSEARRLGLEDGHPDLHRSGEVLQRLLRLRLLVRAHVDALFSEERPCLRGGVERLGRQAFRRELENHRVVGVEPELCDELPREAPR